MCLRVAGLAVATPVCTKLGGFHTLEDLEVLDVCVFGVDVEFHASHGHIAVDAIVNLAEGGAVGSRHQCCARGERGGGATRLTLSRTARPL